MSTYVDPSAGQTTGQQESLSSWAAPYVTSMLGKGEALSNTPYQAYTGPLTAGQSGLQTQAFQGLGALNVPTAQMGGFTPMSITGVAPIAPTAQQTVTGGIANTFGIDPNVNTSGLTGVSFSGMNTAEDQAKAREMGLTPFQYAQAGGMGANVDQRAMQADQQQMQQSPIEQYMSPYLQASLEPQLAEAQRQAQIQQMQNASRLGKAGAFGGSRQAIMESEGQRNLLRNMADITGRGYQQAYTQGLGQFNIEQDRAQQAQDLTNRYGLSALGAQQTAGGVQRGIEQQGIAADLAQFQEERDYPFKQVQYQQSLLQGLPIEAMSYDITEPAAWTQVLGGAGALTGLASDLFRNPTTGKWFWEDENTGP